jgi:hypothetical protein
MLRLVSFGLTITLTAAALGCGTQQPAPPGPSQPSPDLSNLAQRYATSKSPDPPRPGPRARRGPAPYHAFGTWVPSGWMGDAEPEFGALSHAAAADDPTIDEWTYDPTRDRLRWAAVAYQWPESNFGAAKGKDLSAKGYERLTFKARAKEGAVRVVFKSGGHTAPGARYPATYEATAGVVSLSSEWVEVQIPLAGLDLSNCPAALVVVFTEQLCPRGGTIQVRDIAFRGSAD